MKPRHIAFFRLVVRKSWSKTVSAVVLVIALLSFGSVARADDEVQVVPPGATVAGKTIGEWTGRWWKAAIEAVLFPFPAGVSQPGALGDVGGSVFFAVASPGPGSTTYSYNVPRGKYVLLPLFTYVWTHRPHLVPADPCSDFDCSKDLGDNFVRATTSMSVRIDGSPVADLDDHYEATPRFFSVTPPLDGWWAAGDPTMAVLTQGFTSGFWLMLEPLGSGRHVLSIAVTAPFSSVCADGSQNCPIPSPGPPVLARTTLILTVPCDDNDSCEQQPH